MDEKYVFELLKLADKAYKHKDVPISALIVCNEKIIAKAYNKRYKKHNVLNHAEIIAINKAAKKIKDWRLDNCDLYVTLKPCKMCEEVIKASRIKNTYYLIDKLSTKKEFSKTEFKKMKIKNSILDIYRNKLSEFFKVKRKK